jgi:hypothetical protein
MLDQPLKLSNADRGRFNNTKLMRTAPPTEDPVDGDGDEVAADVVFGVLVEDGV